MTEQVLLTDDSAVRIVRLNSRQRKTALTRALSLLATARPLCAEAAEPPGSDAVDAAQVVEEAMQAAVALSGTRLRGGVVVETVHFTKHPQSDETAAAPGAFLSRKV